MSRLDLPGSFDLLTLAGSQPDRYPFLMTSSGGSRKLGRYDILCGFPGKVIQRSSFADEDFFPALSSVYAEQRRTALYPDLPFEGGWFLFLAYEMAGEVEPVLSLQEKHSALPIAMAVEVPAVLVMDHLNDALSIITPGDDQNLQREILQDIEKTSATATHSSSNALLSEEEDGLFTSAVSEIRELILSGDVFQVNLSREWQVQFDTPPSAAVIYRALCRANPAPFAALMQWQGKSVISSTPERLIKVADGMVETRPIAGTRPRGQEQDSDEKLKQELLLSPKERAEHIMLVDLERNDLGRVCQPGSVEVDELMTVEPYAHVQHIVSNVRGRLREDAGPAEIIKAVFPGGTITGCPKVRCMEIIRDLEATPRGPYTGSLGYLAYDGRMDLNILIRTMLLDGPKMSFRAGAGIVADSVPEQELAETRSKAAGLIKALGL